MLGGDSQTFHTFMVLFLGQSAVPLLFHSYPHVNGAVQWAVQFGIFLVLCYLIGVLVWVIVPSVDEPDILS